MFGEVKLGEADCVVVWETLLFIWNILCLLKPTAYSMLFAVGKYEKNIRYIFFNFANMIKPGTYAN